MNDRYTRYILMNHNSSQVENPCNHPGFIEKHKSYPALQTIGTGDVYFIFNK